jgi:hypothetical protein
MILKRSLLVALCVLAVASVTSRPAGSSPSGRRAAAPSTARPTVTQPAIAAPPATVATSTPRTVATRFAAAYARYLQGALPANRLPVLLPAARAMVVQSGPLPARLRVRQLRLTAIYGARDGWTARFAILDGRGRGEVSAELLLTHIRSRWEVAEVVAPDLETLLTAPTPGVRPTGPAAARRAAMGFVVSYLAYTYGHAGVGALRDLTPKLRGVLGGHPPRVPESIRRLEPRVAPHALVPPHRVGGGRERHRRTEHPPDDQRGRPRRRAVVGRGSGCSRATANNITRRGSV